MDFERRSTDQELELEMVGHGQGVTEIAELSDLHDY